MSAPLRVLFLCTGNSARSILFASMLNHLGAGRFEAHSAGSQPVGFVHPGALHELQARGIPTQGLRSKSWDEYSEPDAALDVVITVCDSAAAESCPVFFGDFVKAHWGLPDPASVVGSEQVIRTAFARTADAVFARVEALVALPLASFDRASLQRELARIGIEQPAPLLVDVSP